MGVKATLYVRAARGAELENHYRGISPIRAIDVHVHPSTRGLDCGAIVYFGRDLNNLPRTEETLFAFFTKQNVKGLLIAWLHPQLWRLPA